jgi:hypothetical protein
MLGEMLKRTADTSSTCPIAALSRFIRLHGLPRGSPKPLILRETPLSFSTVLHRPLHP